MGGSSVGGGSTSSSSGSKPLTAAQRYSGLAGALSALSGQEPEFDKKGNVINPGGIVSGSMDMLNALGDYEAPVYKGLADGDYDRLEQEMLASRTAPLEALYNRSVRDVDNDAAKRGIWSSGLVMQGQNDLTEKFAPEFRAAAGEAAAARLAAESQDLAQKNTFDLENANRVFNAKWTPANYLKDAYHGTGGTISTGSSSGWNASI